MIGQRVGCMHVEHSRGQFPTSKLETGTSNIQKSSVLLSKGQNLRMSNLDIKILGHFTGPYRGIDNSPCDLLVVDQ